MKTKLLLIALLTVTSFYTFAQSLVLIHEGEELEPNAELVISGVVTANELVIELDVKNTSSYEIITKVQRYEISIIDSTENTFCWAGQCSPPWIGLSGSDTIAPGAVIEDEFSGHYQPKGHEGTSTIAYTFFDVNNPNDTARVTAYFQAGTIGVEELSLQKTDVSVYPNPAIDLLNMRINSEVNEVITYELLSITGSVVKKDISLRNSAKFSVTDLSEGLYLYRVSTDKNIIKTGRVIVKH